MVIIKNDLLQRPLDRLQQALAADARGAQEAWIGNYDDVLSALDRAIREHVAETETASGALTILESPNQQTAATLDRRVHGLRLEHVHLVAGVSGLHLKVHSLRRRLPNMGLWYAPVAEISWLRHEGKELLHHVREHQKAERLLLMDTLNTDVGVGD